MPANWLCLVGIGALIFAAGVIVGGKSEHDFWSMIFAAEHDRDAK